MDRVEPAVQPRVLICVAPARRRRLSEALAGLVAIEPHESFTAVERALAARAAPAMVILGSRDDRGMEAGSLLGSMIGRAQNAAVVMYATAEELAGGAISSPVISDVIVADETDRPEMIRLLARRLLVRGAASRVVAALRERLSGGVATLAETAVRHPDCTTVQAAADRIGVHRQTLALWCRNAKCPHPEEILVWSRLLLVGAVLEETGYSATTLATELQFPSVVALRNQLKRYTGMTAQEIRAAGLGRMLESFDECLARPHEPPRLAFVGVGEGEDLRIVPR